MPRRLSVWVWYPAERDAAVNTSRYAPGSWSGLGFAGAAAFFEGPLANVHPNSSEGPLAARGEFPIVVLEPGMGLAAPQFTTLAEGLVSEGYIVAGVTPTYSANLTVLAGRAVSATPTGKPADLGLHDPVSIAQADRLVST